MAQIPPHAGGDAIVEGVRLTDFAGLDLTVEGLASGGMGLVVWGRNALNNGEMEALKLLKPDRLAAASSRAAREAIERQFEEEALTWCHLWMHQCIVSANVLTRLTALDDLPVLVLEYAPSGSLADQLHAARQQRRPLSLRAALAWALHIASALAHMHQRDPAHGRPDPLVHCDLKLENVLLDAHGWAKLTDLGLTRAYAALAAETIPSMAPGAASALDTQMDRRELVAQLRAELQGQGLLQGMAGPPPLPDAATLFAAHTLAVLPTQAITPRAMGSAPGGATPAAEELIGVGVAGSPPYMAPEQWRGLEQTVPATDLYAYGTLLYALFAGYEAPAPFPRDPTQYLTSDLYARALMTGNDPLVLAWHAAHTDPAHRAGGRGAGAHRLSDPDARAAALRSGPCSELLADGSAAGRQRAEACLQAVDGLIERCLAYAPTARPSAAEAVEVVQALVAGPCGMQPIQAPKAYPSTPQTENIFWSDLGITYSKLRRQNEAIDAKRHALEHDPADPIAWLNLGVSLNNLGDQETKSANQAEDDGQIERAAALRIQARQHQEEALKAYEQTHRYTTPEAIKEAPNLPLALATNEGAALSNLHRYAEAVAADKRALAVAPNDPEVRFNLALHYARWSQADAATRAEQLERLEAAQREITGVLVDAPKMSGGQDLKRLIERALAELTRHS